jgi:peptidoglycan/LPS O-acetylase OafA/YrhL
MSSGGRNDTRIELLRVIGALAVFVYHFMGDAETVLAPSLAALPAWRAVREGSGPYFSWSWPRAKGAWDSVRRRLRALFPLYWWVAVPLTGLALVAGRMPLSDLWKVPVWFAGLGILSPLTFFPVIDGWWYMTLALQLILIFPLLRRIQDRSGDAVLLVGSCAVTVGSVLLLRYAGLEYAVAGFVGSRCVEFSIGMVIGRRQGTGVRSWPTPLVAAMMLAALVLYAMVPSSGSWRVLFAPLTVVVLLGLVRNAGGSLGEGILAAGGLSFAFYLSHSPWAKPILGVVAAMGVAPWLAIGLGGAGSLVVACVIAWGFRTSFDVTEARLRRGIAHRA